MTRRLLAVLAHPDDESFGIGGTLARYSAAGVDVHIAIATDGVAGSVVEGFQGARDQLAAVRAQELAAAVTILGGTLHTLGYRDSGYIGDPANEHPSAFVQADEQEAVGRVVKLIRELRPQVVITHDETGGYFHPDHIQCWKITTAAFHAAGDPAQYPEMGPAPYQPQRLYYSVFSNRWVKFAIWMMRLRGIDPTRYGRNQDIDMTRIGVDPAQVTTFIDYKDFWERKQLAGAQHPSQGGGTSFSRLLPEWLQKRIFGKETFILAYPPLENGRRETDLFSGIQVEETPA
ncbi:MAG: PIG-L deacetylase family protein [Anaerolineae bacterium]